MAGEKGKGKKKVATKAQGGDKSGKKKAPTSQPKKPNQPDRPRLNLGYVKIKGGKLIPTTAAPVKPVINLGYIPKGPAGGGGGGIPKKKPLGKPKSRTIVVGK